MGSNPTPSAIFRCEKSYRPDDDLTSRIREAVANPRTYRALVKRSGGPLGSSPLHLIRDDAEASLCGIPRVSLSAAAGLDDVVCAECLTWFERRRAMSGAFPTVAPRK